MSDLVGTIRQSAIDKLLGSLAIPFPVFVHDAVFNPKEGTEVWQSQLAVKLLLEKAAKGITAGDPESEEEVVAAVGATAQDIITQAKAVLDTESEIDPETERTLRTIAEGDIRRLGDFIEVRAHLAHLKVDLASMPRLELSCPEIDLEAKLTVDLVAESRERHKKLVKVDSWKWDWRWTEWRTIVRISPSGIKVAAAAQLRITAEGPRVVASAVCKRLRLDYFLLQEIALEGVANRYLAGMPQVVYDAAQLMLAVPILNQKFGVESTSFPPAVGAFGIEVAIRKL